MSRGVGDSSGGSFGFELLRGTGPGVMAIASHNRIDEQAAWFHCGPHFTCVGLASEKEHVLKHKFLIVR